ncbi:mitochondrial sodium/calcium exchanger protein-like [Venturia canescens]|uniref:mitochondrial sodium/calcium exchanger protein-like n=1 Tax=Venturia canescens TaxID=32260 RepID=UPI001C9C6C51|nr:mitochondrial sodium/calcium exchanger protein-like [Venturia canescens]
MKIDRDSLAAVNSGFLVKHARGTANMSRVPKPVPKYGGFQIRDNDCSYVWLVAPEERCTWVTNQENCITDSIIQYTQLLFCYFSGSALFGFGLILNVLWLFYLFLILGTTADNLNFRLFPLPPGRAQHENSFCPSLSVIAEVMHLSENIAGVTILAFGNGAPDIFTSLVSDEREMIIMFTELIGAGIFVTAIIAGSVVLVSPCRIPFKSFTRDCCFYIIAVSWIAYTSEDQIIHLWEALSLIFIYIMFLAVVIAMQIYDNREEMLKGRIPRLQDPELLRTYVAYRTGNQQSNRRPSAGLTLRSRAYSLRAKLDVAIATEMAMKKRMAGVTDDMAAGRSADEDDEAPPPSHRPTGLFREFLYDISPITAQEWADANVCVKIILVLRAPVTFVLQCIIPVVNETAEKRGWSKLLNCTQLVISPTLALVKLEVWHVFLGPMPILLIVFILSVAAASYVFWTTNVNESPKYHNAFAFLGFGSAMLVVYVIANEVMAVLHCFGYASGITDAMLGITLLAWGNSIGDLISNVAIARRGFPRMGYSACFGGPLFNTLLGLGLSWALAAARHDNYRTKIRTSDMMPGCLTFLLASLIASLIYLNVTGFLARRSYGYLLFSLYAVFLFINILSEVHFIHPLGTDHRDN